jgi:protein-disulfide isomerase
LPQIDSEYIKTGKLKYIVRDFPLEAIHKEAFKAAEAAHCAGDQGKFWEMHVRLYDNQRALGLSNLSLHAQALGLEMPRFQECLDGGKYATKVRKDLADGQKAGITGTPAFLLGVTVPNDPMVKVIRVLKGAQPYASFKSAIESLLSSME